jgi:hypothetical protein
MQEVYIEGGRIPRQYLQKGQIWANLCIVLDRPFEDGMEWQQLTDSNPFSLKEASITSYNESQVNYAYAMIMHYYITHSHEISNKANEENVKMVVQVHRNRSGPRHIELLEQLLLQCYPELDGVKQVVHSSSKYELFSYRFSNLNLEVTFCYGSTSERLRELAELGKYQEADVVLSFSLVAGLHPAWPSGSMLIPVNHVPFSLKDVAFFPGRQYSVKIT